MLTERDLKKLLNQLSKNGQFELEGTNIVIRTVDEDSKFSLSTPVYNGGNFIPKSVRQCLSHKGSFADNNLNTYLTIDETNYKIYLNYLGNLNVVESNAEKFETILDDFHFMAEQWRLILDEHDRHDLVHVRVS